MIRRSVKDVLNSPKKGEYCVLVTRYYPGELRFSRTKLQDSPFYTPRGAWDRDLAPSPDLLRNYKNGVIEWKEYSKRFIVEVPAVRIRRKTQIHEEQAKGKEIVYVCEEEDWQYPHCHTWIILDVLSYSLFF